jgi:cyclopropane-fatty-acyl-phospholipid synthase
MTSIVQYATDLSGYLVRNVVQPALLPLILKNIVPDIIVRYGVQRELIAEIDKIKRMTVEEQMRLKMQFIDELRTMPIAIHQAAANEQHYELPAEFFKLVLGPCLKYSSGYWPSKDTTFEQSEVAMLELYCERAGLVDGMKIVDLGCGWGSVTLYMAKKYPRSSVVSISNSNSQREFIMKTAADRGLTNVNVYTGDIVRTSSSARADTLP